MLTYLPEQNINIGSKQGSLRFTKKNIFTQCGR